MIPQEDDYGCGVACVANLLEINYADALVLFNKPNLAIDGKHCFARDIAAALQIAGLDSEYKYLKPRLKKQIYQPGTIVFIRKSNLYPAGHYLLRINSGWIDPWINLPAKPRAAGIRKRLPGTPTYFIRSKQTGGYNVRMVKQDFSKKAVIVVSKELEQWQVLNAVAHISAYIGNQLKNSFGTGENFVTKDGYNHPRNSQYAIITLRAKPGQLPNLMSKVRESGLLYHGFIREMIETTDDSEIVKTLAGKPDEEIEYLGVGIFGPKDKVDALTKNYQLWR